MNKDNYFMLTCDYAVVSEFRDFCKSYRGEEPLQIHIDTSFDAHGWYND